MGDWLGNKESCESNLILSIRGDKSSFQYRVLNTQISFCSQKICNGNQHTFTLGPLFRLEVCGSCCARWMPFIGNNRSFGLLLKEILAFLKTGEKSPGNFWALGKNMHSPTSRWVVADCLWVKLVAKRMLKTSLWLCLLANCWSHL